MRIPASLMLRLWGLCMVQGFGVIIALRPQTSLGAAVAIVGCSVLSAAIALLVRAAYVRGRADGMMTPRARGGATMAEVARYARKLRNN